VTERGANITLVDDEGNQHEFTLVEVIEVAAQRYAVLQPEDPEEAAVVFRVEGETLLPIADDAEFDRVVEALRELEEYDELTVADGATDEAADDETDDEDGASGDGEVN
jgi:uncharacterized protein YrzB (UPF0473 family)